MLFFFFLAQPADKRDADTLETEGDTSDNVVEYGPGPKDDDLPAGNDEGTFTPSSTFATSIRKHLTTPFTSYFFFSTQTRGMQVPGKQAAIPLFVLARMVLDVTVRTNRRRMRMVRLPQAALCHSVSPNN